MPEALEVLVGISCASTVWEEAERLIPIHMENVNNMTSLYFHIIGYWNGMII
jgi:hypothetical protein